MWQKAIIPSGISYSSLVGLMQKPTYDQERDSCQWCVHAAQQSHQHHRRRHRPHSDQNHPVSQYRPRELAAEILTPRRSMAFSWWRPDVAWKSTSLSWISEAGLCGSRRRPSCYERDDCGRRHYVGAMVVHYVRLKKCHERDVQSLLFVRNLLVCSETCTPAVSIHLPPQPTICHHSSSSTHTETEYN